MINWARVNELRAEVGEEDFEEVVHLFLEEVDDAIMRLGENTSADSRAADLHFLRGSAVSLGFCAFATRCAEAEQKTDVDASEIAMILKVYEDSKVEFLSGLPRTVAA